MILLMAAAVLEVEEMLGSVHITLMLLLLTGLVVVVVDSGWELAQQIVVLQEAAGISQAYA